MAICSNNAYVVLGAGSPEFNDIYIQTGSYIPLNATEPFSIYTGQTNGYKLQAAFTGPDLGPADSNWHWSVSNSTADGEPGSRGYSLGGWGNIFYGSNIPLNCIPLYRTSVSNFGPDSSPTVGSVLVTTPESLRSTRQKLYIHSTAEYEGTIWSGEYTLQPDVFNNFSWWRNEATGAVIVAELDTNNSGVLYVRWCIFKNISDANAYFNDQSGIYYATQNIVEIANSSAAVIITPREENASGPTQGSLGVTVISYQPFQDPLPRQTDFDALTGFFGRPGLTFTYKDFDKYSLYTFKGAGSLFRGTEYPWEINLNSDTTGNILFLEWVKSLQSGVDYKLEGKKVFLNKNSQKLQSLNSITLDGSSLKTINTSALGNIDNLIVRNSSIDNIILGNADAVTLTNLEPLSPDKPGVSIQIDGSISVAFTLGDYFDTEELNINENAFRNMFGGFTIPSSFVESVSDNILVGLYKPYVNSNRSATALDDLNTLDRLLNIDEGLFTRVQQSIAIRSAAGASSGSGSGSGEGTSVGVTDYFSLLTEYHEFTKIAPSYGHTLALSGTKLFVTGDNTSGQLGLGAYPYSDFDLSGLSTSVWSSSRVSGWVNIPGDFTDIAVGSNTSFALSGTALYSCGANKQAFTTGHSRSGLPTTDVFGRVYTHATADDTKIWSLIPGDWKKISVGGSLELGTLVALLSTNNTLHVFGNNTFGYRYGYAFTPEELELIKSNTMNNISTPAYQLNHYSEYFYYDTPLQIHRARVLEGSGDRFYIGEVVLDDIACSVTQIIGLSGKKLVGAGGNLNYSIFGMGPYPEGITSLAGGNAWTTELVPGEYDRIFAGSRSAAILSAGQMFVTGRYSQWRPREDYWVQTFPEQSLQATGYTPSLSVTEVWLEQPFTAQGVMCVVRGIAAPPLESYIYYIGNPQETRTSDAVIIDYGNFIEPENGSNYGGYSLGSSMTRGSIKGSIALLFPGNIKQVAYADGSAGASKYFVLGYSYGAMLEWPWNGDVQAKQSAIAQSSFGQLYIKSNATGGAVGEFGFYVPMGLGSTSNNFASV